MTTSTLTLTELPLLASLPDDILPRLQASATRRTYEAGQVIALEGDICREALFVARGLVRVRQLSLEGREHVLAYVGPGACLNLVSALDGEALPASLEAIEETVVYALPCGQVRDLLGESAGFAEAVAMQLAHENRRLSHMVRDLALYSVRARLARFLLQHAEYVPPQERWTQATIAASIGTVRDVVGRALRAFADEGTIRRERGRLRIIDRERLERAAHEE
jgi:CRP-like cAMP-binding protein